MASNLQLNLRNIQTITKFNLFNQAIIKLKQLFSKTFIKRRDNYEMSLKIKQMLRKMKLFKITKLLRSWKKNLTTESKVKSIASGSP